MAEQKKITEIYALARQLVSSAERLAAEGKEISNSIIQPLTECFKQILDFSTTYLIAHSNAEYRFYGQILMYVDLKINYQQKGAMDIDVKTPISIGINPMHIARYPFLQAIGLIVNELNKLVYEHPSMFANLNPNADEGNHELLDMASDMASTSVIKRDVRTGNDFSSSRTRGMELPADISSVSKVNSENKINIKENLDIKQYFEILKKLPKKKSNANSNNSEEKEEVSSLLKQLLSGSGIGNGNNNNNSNSNGNSNGQSNNSNNGSKQPNPNGISTRNNQDGQSIHNWEKTDKDEMRDTVKTIVSDIYNKMSERDRGLLPAGLVQQIEALLAPPQINWKQILRKMVGNIPVPYRKTRRKLNRRQPTRPDLCGKLPKRTVNVVCAFDTSGSMSDNDIKYCINEVYNIVKNYEGHSITIIECDAEIGRIYKIKKPSDVSKKVTGRGGTSFVPVIEYINGEEKYRRQYPAAGTYKDALLVYFTDGFGDYEIPKPKTYRNLWVIMGDEKNLSLKEPYGDVKSINTDKDYIR